jgi:hypothetical protein
MATRATAAAICVANPLGEDAVSDVFTAVELATNNCFDILNHEIFPDEPAIPRKLILPRPDCIPKLTSQILLDLMQEKCRSDACVNDAMAARRPLIGKTIAASSRARVFQEMLGSAQIAAGH